MDKKTKKILWIIGTIIILYLAFFIGYLEGARKNTKIYIEGYKEGLNFNAQKNFNSGYDYSNNETTNIILDNCFNYYCNLDLNEWDCISEQNINITKEMCYDIIFNRK